MHTYINIIHELDMLERNHLTIIQEVDRLGTLSDAAKYLHLTQSALSHTIKKLETRLGTKIWQKDGRRLQLTQAGKHLLFLANRLLPQFEHAEELLKQYAEGQRGILRIGMECHPCYQWLLTVVSPFLQAWPHVDLDIKQKFQFGGIGALFEHEIDMLITPDPIIKSSLSFTPVFDYELVLVVSKDHPLASKKYVTPEQVSNEVLLTYPVEKERLDIFNQFLLPDNYLPRKHKLIENTEIILQMVADGRGVSALPQWLVNDYAKRLSIKSVKLGKRGISKQIFIGNRKTDNEIDYIKNFIRIAKNLLPSINT